MNVLDAMNQAVDWAFNPRQPEPEPIIGANEECPFCGSKAEHIKCCGMPDCKKEILHLKGTSSLAHICLQCCRDLGKCD